MLARQVGRTQDLMTWQVDSVLVFRLHPSRGCPFPGPLSNGRVEVGYEVVCTCRYRQVIVLQQGLARVSRLR